MRARHLKQYLPGTEVLGLEYRRLPKDVLSQYKVFSDISSAPTGGKSQEAGVQFLGQEGCHLVGWHSARQDLTAWSTCESELIGASSAASKALAAQFLVQELTQRQLNVSLGVDNLPSIRQL